MNNGDLPANPLASEELSDRFYEGVEVCHGLTKREHFSGLAMLGILVNAGRNGIDMEDVHAEATKQADALLKTLEK